MIKRNRQSESSPLLSDLIESLIPIKFQYIIAIAAVYGSALFGPISSNETISDHPRWKEYVALNHEGADAFAYRQKTGD